MKVPVSGSASRTKNVSEPSGDSMKRPGASSASAERSRIACLRFCSSRAAHGEANTVSAAIATNASAPTASVGRSRSHQPKPQACMTAISLSR